MAKSNDEQLLVWLDDPAYGPLQEIGSLFRGERGTIRFVYDRDWLRHTHTFQLDPELFLVTGNQFSTQSHFAVFLDSCPDRWGRVLMKRREAIEAKAERRPPKTLTDWDYLVGVQDLTRMGALRFSAPGTKQFLADEALAAPPVTRIAELQQVALALENSKEDDLDKIRQWLRVLVAPGSSLGGARPKANITNTDGSLWIAKFPANDDDHDVALWEKLVHDMARRCGITVPESEVQRIGNHRHHTFLVQRFDRVDGHRRFFTSAMTVLERKNAEEGSYLDLAEFLSSVGEPRWIDHDLREMFSRVVFNVATANRDDHLRNHGFMRLPDGWRLAPAYDMNPSPKTDHVLALDTDSTYPDLNTVLATAPFYRLRDREAEEIVDRVLGEVRQWQTCAAKLGIPRSELLEQEHLFMV